MTTLRTVLLCVLLALAGDTAGAALFGTEKRAFEAAEEEFRYRFWDRAEVAFAEFIDKHPKSERLADAILFQAQAQYRQKKYDSVVALLMAREADAGTRADQFLYWRAEAQFQNGNYTAAAETFRRLAQDYPASTRRLEAAVGEAAAEARLQQWSRVLELLQKPDGAFRQAALGLTNNEMVARGYLLQAEAQLAEKQYPAVEVTVKRITQELPGELDWRRRNLLCQALMGAGRTEDALRESVGLVSAAVTAQRRDLLSESVVFRASVLEQLGKREEAIAVLERNLDTNAPPARQEQALSRITTLALEQGRYDVAVEKLQSFLNQFPASSAAELALLTLGEVQLKQYATLPATNQSATLTNRLPAALNCFDRVIATYSNSTLIGRAQLGRGWCYWMETNYPASAAAFGAAVEALPPSEELAVARFKLADAEYAQSNYVAALENYRQVLALATNWPAANTALRIPASYQALRSSLALTNLTAAEEAMEGILAADEASAVAPSSLLLVAQAYVDTKQSTEAQRLFEKFVALFQQSALRPQIELLVARGLEDQSAWTNAIAAYDGWLTQFPSNDLRPRVEFQRALAVARSGDETNALGAFTNFVARYRTNELAPRAQWWVADYFFNRGDYAEAEINFKQLFQTWKSSDLANEARMMAGRAAMQWSGFPNAIEYFTGLTSDTNCPPDLWARALLALGSAKMRLAPAETNRVAGYTAAIQVFSQIDQRPTTGEYAAQAWGEVGNCYLQMATIEPRNYAAASNAYQKVISLPSAGVTARSQAQCALGIVLEKMAETSNGDERKALLLRARDLYLDVALEKNLREGESADEFWVKESGLKALRLLELMQGWPTQDPDSIVAFCRKLQQMLPVLGPRLETVIARVSNSSPPEKS